MIPFPDSAGLWGAAREMQGWLSTRFSAPARRRAPSGPVLLAGRMEDSVVGAFDARLTPNGEKKVRRYTVCREVAYGGTATVHLGMLEGAAGFRRPIAIKRIREELPRERKLSSALRREALLGCHIRHPNVVPVLDLVQADGELLLIMEFVLGETLARLQKAGGKLPLPISVAIMSGVLRGLHAAHNATGESDEPLNIVHRDVSPQNVLVGADGIARVIDFGVAKAVSSEPTSVGYLKGKIGYFAPEQFLEEPLDARTDVFAAGVVLWEAVAGRRLFQERNPVEGVLRFLSEGVLPPSELNPDVPRELDSVIARALQRSPEWRFETAEEFADAIEAAVRPASPGEVATYLRQVAGPALEAQRALLASAQLAGQERPTRPPLASAHGSIRFSRSMELEPRDEEPTVIETPAVTAPRLRSISGIGAKEEAAPLSELLTEPLSMPEPPTVAEPFTVADPLPLPEPAPPAEPFTVADSLDREALLPGDSPEAAALGKSLRLRVLYQKLSANARVLVIGILVGAVLGIALSWQMARLRPEPASVSAAGPAAIATPAAVQVSAASEPLPEAALLPLPSESAPEPAVAAVALEAPRLKQSPKRKSRASASRVRSAKAALRD